MILDEDNYLQHYGILRRSGRYPWGSGETPYERSSQFISMVADLRKQGLSDPDIAKGFGMTTTQFRNTTTIARNEKRAADISMINRLADKGMSNVAIGERMGMRESTVRSLRSAALKDRNDVLKSTSNMLKDQVDKHGFIDVGSGVEQHLAVSSTKLGAAVSLLKDQGYEVHSLKLEQLGTGKMTEYKVLCRPGTTQKEAWLNRDKIQQPMPYSQDGGKTFLGIHPPLSIDSKRVGIRYAEDGGTHADGVIYVRPGVHDVSLGGAHYAQVRIAVDGTHYLKGMAMYKDDLPKGVDLEFNTNKSNTGNKLDAMKKMEPDPDNPFGSMIDRQITHEDEHGHHTVTSVMNLVNEEGTWDTWAKSLSSQFLSKQNPKLAEGQLKMALEQKKNDLDVIMKLTNPTVKRELLEKFADETDASAWHLKAAKLPRQATKVILPINTLKENEVYAPTFNNGERVVLVRFPHGGTFEIPELTVNNRHPDGRKLIGPNAPDTIGINHKVAQHLSGADFDGDTVLVIPNNSGLVRTSRPLQKLTNFDPRSTYPPYEGMHPMDARTKGVEMGRVSNLITDMTIKGASDDELARAVRHSMVVIDAEKHKLNWKQSEIDNGIPALKEKYQGGKRAGAATLISRKKQEDVVPERKQLRKIDPTTGKLIYTPTGRTRINKNGEVVPRTEKAKKILEIDNVRELSSGTKMENLYADHANALKELANKARLETTRTKNIPYSPSAKIAYAKEVSSLGARLNIALRNRPLERQAQVLANAWVREKIRANPGMEKDEVKKIKRQALNEARTRTGASKNKIEITQEEWNAIQAGAITNNQLHQILRNSNLDTVRKLATPKTAVLMTPTKTARATQMLDSGYTLAEVAQHLGVSVSTLQRSVGGE